MQRPLSAEVSTAKCIQNANAFYALSAGEGNSLTVWHLLCVVYATYFINEMIEGKWPVELFRVAETALHECALSGERSEQFDIPVVLQIEIQRVLSLYAHHLASVPMYIHVSADERVAEFLSSDSASPIAREPSLRSRH